MIDWTCCWQDARLASTSAEKQVLVISPGSIVLCTRDEKTVEGVLRKWREFEKPDGINGMFNENRVGKNKGLMWREKEILGTFGRNVDTVRIYILLWTIIYVGVWD